MIFEKQVVNTFKNMMHSRCDDVGTAYYFSSDDFPGLHKEAYPFVSSMGHKLQGYIYNYDNPIPGRIVVFEHGFFGGHRSYMKEIEKLCKAVLLCVFWGSTPAMRSSAMA